ncbi:MAG: hypothetical protein DRJ42_18880 [Deltaproteobacteria bacterium]|nr:MAG: hypothetical protein DRJ42_18880 [Deltaproteobacteria bacterium]
MRPVQPGVESVQARSQWAGAVMACLLLAGLAAGQVHRLEVIHVVCAEHGELVHARHDGRAADAAPAPTSVPSFGRGSGPADAHEHCDLVFDRRDPVVAGDSVASLAVPETAGITVLAVGATEEAASPAPYLIAPKASPPV